MTEQEWLEGADLWGMILSLKGKASNRKQRLFAVACCRRVWHLLTEEHTREGVEVAERYADSLATEEELSAARDALWQRWSSGRPLPASPHDEGIAAWAASVATTFRQREVTAYNSFLLSCRLTGPFQPPLLHDIFGPLLFREVRIDPRWLLWDGGTVRRLAELTYKERQLPSGHLDPARLAILADALEEAGCTDPDILSHLRGPGPHVRGCWLLDLILNKE